MTASQAIAIWCIDGAWMTWLVIWIALSRRVKQVTQRESLVSRILHIAPLVLATFLLLVGTRSGHSWLERQILPRAPWMLWAGAVLVLVGLAFAVWARLILAGNWSGIVTLKLDHELVRSGPYRIVRHPIYTGLLTALLGTAVAIDEIRGTLAFVIVTASFVNKMQTEEAFMKQAFGELYAGYQADVNALIPGVW